MSEHEADRDDEIVETGRDGRFVRFADKLGSGAFKSVYRGFDTERGIEVAWNQVLYERYNLDLSRVMNEIEVFKSIRNPHIIEFYHAWQDTDAKQVVFITELMPSGTLKQTPNVKLKVLKNWCRQILMGLDYLHSLQPPIIHRDIKCDNIFINGLSEGEVKIGDFGLATFSSREQGMSLAEFMAPEFYSDQYSTAVDIWAFGMLVIELVTHEFPYSECRGIHQICGKVTNGIMPPQLKRITHPALVDFIALCLTVQTESRPTARALLGHPFFELESDGGMAISSLLAPAPEPEPTIPAATEKTAPNPGVVVMDTPAQQPLALNTPYPAQTALDPAGYLSPPPEATLLAPAEGSAMQPDLDGYASQPQLYQPSDVSESHPGYDTDVNAVATNIAPVQLQPFQHQDQVYADVSVTDRAYASDQVVYASDNAYASDTGYTSVSETTGSTLADFAEPQKKDLVSAAVVYLNAVNAGDGQLGLRMNIVTSDGKEQHTDEVSFDFMLNSDTPSSIALEMLRLFDLKDSALPQLEDTISERVLYLAQNVTQDLPVQLEPDYQYDTLLVDNVVQQPLATPVPSGAVVPASDLSRDSSVDTLLHPQTELVSAPGGGTEPFLPSTQEQHPVQPSEPPSVGQGVVDTTDQLLDTTDQLLDSGTSIVLGTDIVADDDGVDENTSEDTDATALVFTDDAESEDVSVAEDEVEDASCSSIDSLAVVKDSDSTSPLALVDSYLEMSPTSQEETNVSASSQPSPQTTRRERSRPRSRTSPMVVPMALPDQAKSPVSPASSVPSVFASPFPDNHRFLRTHFRRESSDLNSSFKFVLPPEEDDIEELESYLDEASPTKGLASSPTRGSTSDYSSLQNCDALSSASTRSQAPRSTVAEMSNSDPDQYDYFTDDGTVPDNCDIFIDGLTDGEEEEEEEDREMMRLRAKQQLELQRLIHAHERELAAAKQSRKESRLRRSSVLKRKNAHLLASLPNNVVSDDEASRSAPLATLNRSFSVPPGEILHLDDSSETGSAG